VIRAAAIALALATLAGCEQKCFEWYPSPPTRNDRIECNATRAGDTAYQGELKYQDCLASLGYRTRSTPCEVAK
jgi:hypothetical protein